MDVNNFTQNGTDNTTMAICSNATYDHFAYVIRVNLSVPMIIFGLLSNTINVIIFRHKRMRHSMVNWYLVALAASDCGILFGSFCMLSLPPLLEEMRTLTMDNLAVDAQRWTLPLGLTMQTASVGMTVLVSGHRFLGVCYPFRAQRLCTPRRVRAAIWFVAAFAMFFNAPRWFETAVHECSSDVYNATGTLLTKSWLRANQVYYNVYQVVLYTLVMFALPFLLLIVMNALIVREVHRSYRLRQMMTNKTATPSTVLITVDQTHLNSRSHPNSALVAAPVGSQNDSAQQHHQQNACNGSNQQMQKENKTTIMLIAVVVTFLLCNSLAFINNILEILAEHAVLVFDTYTYTVEISNLLVVFNSASNFFIYWSFSAKYRLLFRRYVSRWCPCLRACLMRNEAPNRSTPVAAAHRRYYAPAPVPKKELRPRDNAPRPAENGRPAPSSDTQRRLRAVNNRTDPPNHLLAVPTRNANANEPGKTATTFMSAV